MNQSALENKAVLDNRARKLAQRPDEVADETVNC